MRLVGAAFLLALASLPAVADDAKPAEQKPTEPRTHVPLRVVRMLPDAGQALLFDKTKGTYVAVEAGQDVEGFTVDTVDDDEVTLVSGAGATVVLAAPARHRRTAEAGNDDTDAGEETARPVRHRAHPARVAAADTTEPKPADPYATEASPADPYAGVPDLGEAHPSDPYSDGVAVVPAGSLGTGADGVRVAPAAPAPAPVAAPAPATVTVTFTAPAPVAAPVAAPAAVPAPTVAAAPPAVVAPTTTRPPAPARKPTTRSSDDGAAALAAALTGDDAVAETAAAAPTAGAIILARADVRAALSNFGSLTRSVQGGFTADGLRIDSVVAGSLFAKAGLQPGDVVTSVDGKPLRSLDDAANLYARASKARTLTAQVLRGGAPVALRVSIQ